METRGEAAAPLSDAVASAAWCFHLDLMAAEVMAAFEASGCRAILLKGPTFASWLYTDGSTRHYGDVDALVDPRAAELAEGVLRDLGFERLRADESSVENSTVARDWVRGDVDKVDLHLALEGAACDGDSVFETLWHHTETIRVGGAQVVALDVAGRALHIALHASQHGAIERQPMEDLSRALDQLDAAAWGVAADLARLVGADVMFSAGLRLDVRGASLLDELGFDAQVTKTAALRATGGAAAPGMNIARLAAATGIRAKVAWAFRWAFPSGAKMRRLSPEIGESKWRLVMAYARHITRVGGVAREYKAWRDASHPTERESS